jgi:hypothetical protein
MELGCKVPGRQLQSSFRSVSKWSSAVILAGKSHECREIRLALTEPSRLSRMFHFHCYSFGRTIPFCAWYFPFRSA